MSDEHLCECPNCPFQGEKTDKHECAFDNPTSPRDENARLHKELAEVDQSGLWVSQEKYDRVKAQVERLCQLLDDAEEVLVQGRVDEANCSPFELWVRQEATPMIDRINAALLAEREK